MSDPKLAVETWESLFRAQHEIFTELARDFAGGPLSQAEYDVLLNVTRAPQSTARLRDIVRSMLVSQPSVSRLIDRMATRGLLTKSVDPDDGRGALVTATSAGAQMFRQLGTEHAGRIVRRMSRLDEHEQRALLVLTRKLRTVRTTG